MNIGFIKELNKLFREFQIAGQDYENHIGKGLSNESDSEEILKKLIPKKLQEEFPADSYKIKGSIGQGRVAKCPWVAIMHKSETTSTLRGIYLVFLFSRDLKRIYLSLAQGVTKIKKPVIIKRRDDLRGKLKLENEFRRPVNDQQIDGDKYKACAIYSNEWDCQNDEYCENLLLDFIDAYKQYITLEHNIPFIPTTHTMTVQTSTNESEFSIQSIINLIEATGLKYSPLLIKRFVFSLMTKPFVILSGLAGSGKTQIALAFAKAMAKDESQICTVAVGADWTNREPLLGFPNALNKEDYICDSKVLDLLIEANKPGNSDKPFFLILDEMNMSYVERYFADFLSAMESGEPIHLWKGNQECKTPSSISIPKNLYIIGTINVDETTYMFSPKVLDRASVIEFKVSESEMEDFLNQIKKPDIKSINGKASAMAKSFVKKSNPVDISPDNQIASTLIKFFKELKSANAEFGYRTATEIYRYIQVYSTNDDTGNKNDNDILDSAIAQKLLPKLHGSRRKLSPILGKLWELCGTGVKLESEGLESVPSATTYQLTADKILRMYKRAVDNGFTSFSEA